MNKHELVKSVAARTGLSIPDAAMALTTACDMIANMLQNGQHVTITGFGSFVVKVRKPRVCYDPRTRQKIQVPAKRVVKFQPAKILAPVTVTPEPDR